MGYKRDSRSTFHQKELQGEVRYDADVRGTSGTLPKGTEESTGRDGQNRAADEKTGRGDRAAYLTT